MRKIQKQLKKPGKSSGTTEFYFPKDLIKKIVGEKNQTI
jgi:hypothetical protein